MTLTKTPICNFGEKAKNFSLVSIENKRVNLENITGKNGTLIMFICNHCPYVIHIRDSFVSFVLDYREQGLAVVAICANDVRTHPDDSPEKMAEEASKFSYPFPYLYDESQAVARGYRAACTPDFFLYNRERTLVYRGQFDGSRPGNSEPVTGVDLRCATDVLLQDAPVLTEQRPSMGCNIKWKSGEEPDYFAA